MLKNFLRFLFNPFIKWLFSPSITELKLFKKYFLFTYKETLLKEHIKNSHKYLINSLIASKFDDKKVLKKSTKDLNYINKSVNNNRSKKS